MSQIPSDISASAAQAGFQANQIAKEHEAGRAGVTHATKRQIRAVDEAGAVVDTEDADVAVFADAEGGGSRGRESQAEPEPTGGEASPTAPEGITRDDDGRLHVDLEA